MTARALLPFAATTLAACASLVQAPVVPSAPPPAGPPEIAVVPPAPPPLPPPAPIPPIVVAPPPPPPTISAPPVDASACNDQAPQEFLVRSHFLRETGGRERAIEYRNQTYGVYRPPGQPSQPRAAGQPPADFTVGTTFMGLPVRMHRKVVPALKCVEEEIKRSCHDHPYTARALAGLRFKNTYRGGEVTNHIYGIAIDVDPDRNTCCGCVKPWNNAPRCQRPAKSEYDRMEMPECWVHGFERFGFYWLGHDVLKDTMHFEFLGDPERIERVPAATTAP